MMGITAWKRLVMSDAAWFSAAALVSLAIGTIIDQSFRKPSLGWRYQAAAERMLVKPEVIEGSVPINLVSIEEAAAAIANQTVLLLDARPRVFHELGHLPGALSLSRERFQEDFALIEPALRAVGKRPLLIYCSDADCEDAAIVARALEERGVGPLLLYPGGFTEWESAGRTVEVSQ